MSYHQLPAFTPPRELIGFGNGSMLSPETPEQIMLAALQAIMADYGNTELSHRDFRVRAAHVACSAIDKVGRATDDFPKPQRRDGKEPCGECRLPFGETCDICGATQKEQTFAGIPHSEHARSGLFGWHPGDEA